MSFLRILRRTSLGQRYAGHSPRHGSYHQGHLLPLQDDEGLPGEAQGRMGYARTPRGAGRGEGAGHHEGRHRQDHLRGRLQRRLPQGRDEVHEGVGGPDA